MAVRHGYGKVAGTDALVFAYDTGDTRNSYKGEPTTNVISQPHNILSGYSNGDGILRASGTNLNFTGEYNAGTITRLSTGTGTWCAYVGSVAGVASGVQFTTTWYLKAGSISSVFISWGGAHTGTRTSLTLNLITGAVTGASVASGEYYRIRQEKNGYYAIEYSSTLTGTNYFPQITLNSQGYIIFGGIQVEKKSHATPFTAGTRSATQGLKDLTGNTSIDLTNAGFDSNAQLDFDGTNTYIPKFTDSRFQFADTDLTYEVVVNFNSNPDSYQTLIGLADTNDYIPRFNLSKFRSGTGTNGKVGNVYMQLIDQNGSGITAGDPDLSGADLVAGGYYHYVGVISKPAGSSTYYVYLYRNGELVTTTNSGRTTYDTTQGVQGSIGLAIGTQFGSTASVLDGQLPVAKIYNRALTAGEVKNNYRNYKGRFNI